MTIIYNKITSITTLSIITNFNKMVGLQVNSNKPKSSVSLIIRKK